MKPKFFRSGFVLLVLAGLCYAPSSVMAQEDKMDHGAMDHSGPAPGQEYRVDEPMDHGDHGAMQHEGDGSLFRSRGSHDQADQYKPEDVDSKSLLARGRNIYMHMCVFCHGVDGNGAAWRLNIYILGREISGREFLNSAPPLPVRFPAMRIYTGPL